ncbi:MAG: Seryl-tRNA synthetase [Sphingobacteriaceae bacterium]|jgi:hypothetical protein|nr:Seryl-tRNA synthetase [Sphingobacteriaceae bacterium]
MKKKAYLLFASLMLAVTVMSVPAYASSKPKEQPTEQQLVRIEQIKDRVEEIQAMDKSNLTSQQRQDLKTELKSMKKEAKALGGGVYLSVGAIIIIILLLILLL